MPLNDKFNADMPTAQAVLRSWLSMKTGVMLWLWYLNVLFWPSFYYLAKPEAVWIAAAYLAVGPIIAVIVSQQRGLTRLSGLIHLPWLPLLVYLAFRLFSDRQGALSVVHDPVYYLWLQLLFWSTLVCVALDTWDVFRWLRGERYVLGTPAAAEAGASKRAKQT